MEKNFKMVLELLLHKVYNSKNRKMCMRKLSSKKIDRLIPDSKIPIRIAFMKSPDIPAVISLRYICNKDAIYCATQKTTKIVSYFKKIPCVDLR